MTERRRPSDALWNPEAEKLEDFLIPNRTALVAIDMQNGLISSSSSGGVMDQHIHDVYKRFVPIISTVKSAIGSCRTLGMPVVWVKTEDEGYDMMDPTEKFRRKRLGGESSMIYGFGDARNWRSRLVPELQEIVDPNNDLIVVKKNKESAFDGFTKDLEGKDDKELHTALQERNIGTLLVCGATTESCIFATLSRAKSLNYFSVLVRDAVESTYDQFQEVGLKTAGGVATAVLTIDDAFKYLYSYWWKHGESSSSFNF